ncbi:dienelactone hydrolase family protein [Pseudonocardia sp. KRD-184]|uniref:Dienelactone hydrolase family protein n=1 Tax=Pseudonocardia oceani TaxID=2792013 RepID=A0ABS6U923_9PSEU|nr:dienelactone hydrolase family protein [Pseudonocardia oceani]MBW0089070.1 dienelactone hydrolase family protein [Pseudonocardia oceani]MBW0095982.1 dienelactone hydrolase family protein [Pseudonocardia oceani]MBW0108707.1 dienelactone hydrolase family protein [Pseudonocardia oceani]MBW0121422.1 dienelactone hydrolase family protein [Pseudonocardia oceani]MBW0128746.1 dienelactone hydrolase family protein [Pseudonocardia oceani]
MTDIRTETVPLVDGSELRLTVGEPVSPVRGGIVVLHEARGVTDTVRGLVSGLAADGWLTVAPHLYHRDGADEVDGDDGQVQQQVDRLDGEQVMADTDTAFGWLAERDVASDRMGVIGFDLGGSVALLVAAQRTLGAAVTVAGEGIADNPSSGLLPLVDAAPGLTCPWLGIYGENTEGERDPEIEQLRDAAAKSEQATDLVVYPRTGYRFDSDPDAAADAWQRTLNWFDSHLR